MKTKLTVFCITAIAFYACSKKESLGKHEYIGFYYEQTKCSDPWETSGDDSVTLENVASYLNAHDLYIAGLSIEQTSAGDASCAACSCKTGKIIYATTLNSDNQKKSYEDIGFKYR